VQGNDDAFRTQYPSTALLVAEIAIGSIEIDRAKAPLYAQAAVPVYWLVLAEQESVEVYTQPGPQGYGCLERRGRSEALETWYGARVLLDELFA
jgi:hypothetical protein